MTKTTLFNIRVPNQPNVLAGLTTVLTKGNVNLIGIVADAAEGSFTFVRFVTSTPVETVFDVLKNNNLEVYTTPVLGLDLKDEPGFLNRVISDLGHQGINIRTIFAAGGTTPRLWIETSDPFRAEKYLSKVAALEPAAA